MAIYIPNLLQESDKNILNKYFNDAPFVRVSLTAFISKKPINLNLSTKTQLWIDPSLDIYHSWYKYVNYNKIFSDFKEFYRSIDPNDNLANKNFVKNPNKDILKLIVYTLLDKSMEYNPKLLSIPQLPRMIDNSTNNLNKQIVGLTVNWFEEQKKKNIKFILPVILTDQEQTNKKINRTPIIQFIKSSIKRASIYGVWVVESTLKDYKGSTTFGKKRFPGIIEFHNELRRDSIITTGTKVIAGPYWGLGLILFAKGLIDFPIVGLGKGYEYYITSLLIPKSRAKARVAIPPLKRISEYNLKLKSWIEKRVESSNLDKSLKSEFKKLVNPGCDYNNLENARDQVANFHSNWFRKIENLPQSGRALALFQDFSNAYVNGSSITDDLKVDDTAKKPGQVAEQFMLNCL